MGLFQSIERKALLGTCLLLTLSFSACDSKSPVEPVNVVQPIINEVIASEASEVVAKEKLEGKPKRKLDLTLSKDVMALSTSSLKSTIAVAESSFDEKNALPNMFGEKQKGTTVGAGILRDAENEDYVDSIQGAEVNVQFKID